MFGRNVLVAHQPGFFVAVAEHLGQAPRKQQVAGTMNLGQPIERHRHLAVQGVDGHLHLGEQRPHDALDVRAGDGVKQMLGLEVLMIARTGGFARLGEGLAGVVGQLVRQHEGPR